MKLIAYRYSVTGASGYHFYENQNELCAMSVFSFLTFPVAISGFGHEWTSEFDSNDTIVPGMTRFVVDDKSKETVCQIVFIEAGRYDILVSGERVRVFIETDQCVFFSGEASIARIKRAYETPVDVPQKLRSYDCELYCRADLAEPMKPELALAILSFPLLRFAV